MANTTNKTNIIYNQIKHYTRMVTNSRDDKFILVVQAIINHWNKIDLLTSQPGRFYDKNQAFSNIESFD